VPTGQDIERFLLSIPQITQSSSSLRDMLSWKTLELALKYTLHTIRCKHDSFRLTYNERLRLKDCLETLRIQGKITKDPVREAQWLTARLMIQLIRALLVQAVTFGVTDWSIVVHKCLGLALQSALSSRAGDIVVTRDYEDNECLSYKDIQLKATLDVATASELPLVDRVVFDAKITLRYTKDKKRDESNNHTVILSSLNEVEFNVVDPLKLLLAHALRHDAIASSNTVEDAVQQALARRDKLIQWKYPDRPVLSAIVRRKFDYSKGAATQQLRETLNEAALLSGISQKLVTHDIRRGAARDAAQLQTYRNVDAAAQALDHSPISVLMGVTAKYIGYNTRSTLADRIHLEPSDRFGLTPADTRLGTAQKKRQLDSAEIDEFLRQPKNARLNEMKDPRRAASRAIKKGRSEQLANERLDASDHARLNTIQTEHIASKPLQPWNASKMNVMARQSTTTTTISSAEGIEGLENSASKQGIRSDRVSVDSNIHPALLLLSGHSTNIAQACSTDDQAMLSNTSTLEDVLDEMEMDEEDADFSFPSGPVLNKSNASSIVTAARAELQILEAPASRFIAWLSRINTRVVNDTNFAQHSNLDHLRGGSRDKPTFFLHRCKYESQGCSYATTSGPSMNYHQATCTPERRQSEAVKNAGVSKACQVPGCSYVARAESDQLVKKRMRRHKYDQHSEARDEIACPIGGRPTCAGPFKNSTALSAHKSRYHSDIVPQRCPVENCKSTNLWTTASTLGDHVRKTHLLTGTELKAIIDAAKAVQGAEQDDDE
jgi:hypothetical protein